MYFLCWYVCFYFFKKEKKINCDGRVHTQSFLQNLQSYLLMCIGVCLCDWFCSKNQFLLFDENRNFISNCSCFGFCLFYFFVCVFIICFVHNLRACFANSSNNSSRSLFFGIFPTNNRWLLNDIVTPIFLPLRIS